MINGMTIACIVIMFILGILGYHLGYNQGRSDQIKEMIAELETMKEDFENLKGRQTGEQEEK